MSMRDEGGRPEGVRPARPRPYTEVDVFGAGPFTGNPVAVVHGAEGLDTDRMQAFARWTNLSETTFLLAADDPVCDYRVRIYTPQRELTFAGHPTLGSCHAWLEAGGVPRDPGVVVQQCDVGPVRIRRAAKALAFAAPARVRTGPLDRALLERIAAALGLGSSEIVDHQWVDNGPGWCAVRLVDAERVLGLEPDCAALDGLMLGVVGAHAAGGPAQFEVRAFVGGRAGYEDPVTGSLNASLGQWMIEAGVAPPSYVAAQGRRLGRDGRVFVERDAGDVWIGGDTVSCVRGEVVL